MSSPPILHAFWLILPLTASEEVTLREVTFSRGRNGSDIDVASFNNVHVVSLLQCAVACSLAPGCLATEYKYSTRSCTMFRAGHGRRTKSTKTYHGSDTYVFTKNVEEDEAFEEMERASTVQEESDAEPAPTGAAAAEKPQEEESQRDQLVALTTPEVKFNQTDAVQKVTEIPPKKTPSQLKVKAGRQRPVKVIKKTFTSGCGTPPQREGTTVNVTEDTAEYKCKPHHRNIGGNKTRSVCRAPSGQWSPVDIFCSNFTTCTMVIDGRSVYNGTVSTTVSGYSCQRWDKQTPNRHWFETDHSFQATTGLGPETCSGASNYCRDPGALVSNKTVWCYTTHPGVSSEPCDVPMCLVPK